MCFVLRAAQSGQHEAQGYANSAYGMSKVGVTVMTGIQQADVDKAFAGKDILINSVSRFNSLMNRNSFLCNCVFTSQKKLK